MALWNMKELLIELKPLLIYFRRNYIGNMKQLRILIPANNLQQYDYSGSYARKARFDPGSWNCHDRVLENQPRTTCSAESFNNTMSERIASRPFYGTFMRGMQKMLNAADKHEIDIIKGMGRKRHTNIATRDVAIYKAVSMFYTDVTVLDYLRACAAVLLQYK